MSTPEARLSAAERAALADLESAAAAADPHLAARLRGHSPAPPLPLLVAARTWLVATWEWSVDRGWWSLPVVAVGLFLIVTGVAAGLYLSLIGAAVLVAGLAVLAEMADRRWIASGRSGGSTPEA
jgi:hypothetical protein